LTAAALTRRCLSCIVERLSRVKKIRLQLRSWRGQRPSLLSDLGRHALEARTSLCPASLPPPRFRWDLFPYPCGSRRLLGDRLVRKKHDPGLAAHLGMWSVSATRAASICRLENPAGVERLQASDEGDFVATSGKPCFYLDSCELYTFGLRISSFIRRQSSKSCRGIFDDLAAEDQTLTTDGAGGGFFLGGRVFLGRGRGGGGGGGGGRGGNKGAWRRWSSGTCRSRVRAAKCLTEVTAF